MATNYSCDRCSNAIFNYTTPGHRFAIPFPDKTYDFKKTQHNDYTRIDLCRDCIKDMRSFLGLEATQRIEE